MYCLYLRFAEEYTVCAIYVFKHKYSFFFVTDKPASTGETQAVLRRSFGQEGERI